MGSHASAPGARRHELSIGSPHRKPITPNITSPGPRSLAVCTTLVTSESPRDRDLQRRLRYAEAGYSM